MTTASQPQSDEFINEAKELLVKNPSEKETMDGMCGR